jgi:hypothetical protein
VTDPPESGDVQTHQDPRPRIGSIVVDCTNVEQMVRFWSEGLHYVPQGPVRPDGVMLVDPRKKGPNLNISRSNEGPATEYRLHLDIYVGEPTAELERFLTLGATVRRPPTKGHDFVELADPDGNPFCLIDIDYPKNRDFWGDDWSFGDHP